MKGLTERQQEILNFIHHYLNLHKISPTYREIQTHFGFSSLASVFKHVHSLLKKGVLQGHKFGPRSLHCAEGTSREIVELPLVGHFTPGMPLDLHSHIEVSFPLPVHLVPNPLNSYVLRMEGDSLQHELIAEGDLLIMEANTQLFADTVALLSLHGRATYLKRYFPEGSHVRLEPLFITPFSQTEIVREEEVTLHARMLFVLRSFSSSL